MATNSNINLSSLDFDTLKQSLLVYLQSQDTFKDYNFEGSSLNVLVDLLAYNTQYNAYYLNMVANELFLDSSTQRSSAVSHAKLLNYTPKSAIAPTAEVNIIVNDVDDASLTLPAYLQFSSAAIDGVNYTFLNPESYTETTVGNTVTFNNVKIKQGVAARNQFVVNSANNPKGIYEIPDGTIDSTTLQVIVQNSSSNTEQNIFTLAQSFISLDSNSQVYFLQEALNGNYEIYFGDGILGKQLVNGNIITVNYLSTEGTNAAGANTFVLMDNIGAYSASSVDSVLAATTGSNKETIDSIKFQAPKVYSAQNRAVTEEDYITTIQQNQLGFAFDAVNVWGGEENDPPVYGAVFIAIKPSGGFLLTQSQKAIIQEEVIKPISVLTVQPRIIDVDYTYLVINSNILYEPKLTTLTSSQLQTQVSTAIQGFAAKTLNTFNSTFKLSSLIATVQSVNTSFVTNDATITLQKRIVPNLSPPTTYTLQYGSPLKKDIFGKSITATPTFQIIDRNNNNIVRDTVYLEETPSSTTFVESISVMNPGFGYTSSPTVTILGDGTGATAIATVVNGQVNNITVTNPGINYTQAIVQITPIDGNGSLASGVAVLAGNKGILRTYYFENNVKRILNANAGTVNYSEGIVTLVDFNPSEINNPLGILSIQAVPTTTIVSSARDKIIALDNTDPNAINVNIVPKV